MNKVCSPLDYFKSFYYNNTHLDSIDLEMEIPKHCLKEKDADLHTRVEVLISNEEVKKILSKPTGYYAEETDENKNILESNNFTLLNHWGTVLKHRDLQGWIIKAGADRFRKERKILIGPYNTHNETALFTEEDSLLRVFMRKRIKKTAERLNIDLVLPKKKFVKYRDADENDKSTQKYCVLAEEIDVLTAKETVVRIVAMSEVEQIKLAKDICRLIKKVGFLDSYFENVRLTNDNKLAIIDTEPLGLMRDSNNRDRKFTHSVEKCARIGLNRLLSSAFEKIDQSDQNNLSFFTREVLRYSNKAEKNLYSKWNITISIVFLPIPIALFIISMCRYVQIRFIYNKSNPRVPSQGAKNKTNNKAYLAKIYHLVEGVRFGHNNPQKPLLI